MNEAKLKVLLVDDDPALLRIMVKWLGDHYSVRTATDGKQAMQLIGEDCPDVLISDWEMPGVNGLQLIRWVRSQSLPRYVYTILLTIRCGKSDIVQGFEAGTDDFLKKPVDKDELISRLLSGNRVIALEHKLWELSRCDTLTGLLNRSAFLAHLDMEWARATRLPIPMSCVLIDLDDFQTINREHGQAVGDRALSTIAEMIAANSRVSDAVCRFSNDRFAVLLVEAGETQATLWAERLKQHIHDHPIQLASGTCTRITASFGVAERCGETLCGNHLVAAAEHALSLAKQAGKNRVSGYGSSRCLGETTERELSVEGMFEHLTARDVMSTVVPTLRATDSVEKGLRYLLRFNLWEVPVVNETGISVGMVSEQDIMTATLDADWRQATIATLVRLESQSFSDSATALELYGYFCRTDTRSAIIVRDGVPTGMVLRQTLMLRLAEAAALPATQANASNETSSASVFTPQLV